MKGFKFLVLAVLSILTVLPSSSQTFKDFDGMSVEKQKELFNAAKEWYEGDHSDKVKQEILNLMPLTVNKYSLNRSNDTFSSAESIIPYLRSKRGFSAREKDAITFWEYSAEIGRGNYYQYNILQPYRLSDTIGIIVAQDRNRVFIVDSAYGVVILVNIPKGTMWKYYKETK